MALHKVKTSPNRTAMILLLLAVSSIAAQHYGPRIQQRRPTYDTSDWIPVAKPCATCHQNDLETSESNRVSRTSYYQPEIQSTRLFSVNPSADSLKRDVNTLTRQPFQSISLNPLSSLYTTDFSRENQNFITQNFVQPQRNLLSNSQSNFIIQPSLQLAAPEPPLAINMVGLPRLVTTHNIQSAVQPNVFNFNGAVAAPLVSVPAYQTKQQFNYQPLNLRNNLQPQIIQQAQQPVQRPLSLPSPFQTFRPEPYVAQSHEDFRLLQNILNNGPGISQSPNSQQYVKFHFIQQSNLSDIVITTPPSPTEANSVSSTTSAPSQSISLSTDNPSSTVQSYSSTSGFDNSYVSSTFKPQVEGRKEDELQDLSTRRFSSSTPKGDVQLLYIPLDQLNRNNAPSGTQNVAFDQFHKNNNAQNNLQEQASSRPSVSSQVLLKELDRSNFAYSSTTEKVSSKTDKKKYHSLKPHQPPLAIFMNGAGKPEVSVADLVNSLGYSKKIDILDQIHSDMPSIFIGPANMNSPKGYAKFDLPYLSNIVAKRPQRKVEDLPFFVAPVSYETPKGYYKIEFPEPHVGSVVYKDSRNNADKSIPSAQNAVVQQQYTGQYQDQKNEPLPIAQAQFSTPQYTFPQKSTPREFPLRHYPTTSSPIDINSGFIDSLNKPEILTDEIPLAAVNSQEYPFNNQFSFFPPPPRQSTFANQGFFQQFNTPQALPAGHLQQNPGFLRNYTNFFPHNQPEVPANVYNRQQYQQQPIKETQTYKTIEQKPRVQNQNTKAASSPQTVKEAATTERNSNRDLLRPTENILNYQQNNENNKENQQSNQFQNNNQLNTQQNINLQSASQQPFFSQFPSADYNPKLKVEQTYFEFSPQPVSSTTQLPPQYFLPTQTSSSITERPKETNQQNQNIESVKAAVFTPEEMLQNPINNRPHILSENPPLFANSFDGVPAFNGENYFSSTPDYQFKSSFTGSVSPFPQSVTPNPYLGSAFPSSTTNGFLNYNSDLNQYTNADTDAQNRPQYLPESVNSLQQQSQIYNSQQFQQFNDTSQNSPSNYQPDTTTQAVDSTTIKKRRPAIIRQKYEPQEQNNLQSNEKVIENYQTTTGQPEKPTRQRFKTRGRQNAARTTTTESHNAEAKTRNHPKKMSYSNTDFRLNSNRVIDNTIQTFSDSPSNNYNRESYREEYVEPEIITAENVGPDEFVRYNVPSRPNQINVNTVQKEIKPRPSESKQPQRSRTRSRYRTTTTEKLNEPSPTTEKTRRFSTSTGETFGTKSSNVNNDAYSQYQSSTEYNIKSADDEFLNSYKNVLSEETSFGESVRKEPSRQSSTDQSIATSSPSYTSFISSTTRFDEPVRSSTASTRLSTTTTPRSQQSESNKIRQKIRMRRPYTTTERTIKETSSTETSSKQRGSSNKKINVNRGKLNFKVMNTDEKIGEEENYPVTFLQAQKQKQQIRPKTSSQKSRKQSDLDTHSSDTVNNIHDGITEDTLRVSPLQTKDSQIDQPSQDPKDKGIMEQIYEEMTYIKGYFGDEVTSTEHQNLEISKKKSNSENKNKGANGKKRGFWRKVRVRPTDVLESAESQVINSASPNQLDLGVARKVYPQGKYEIAEEDYEVEKPEPYMPEQLKTTKTIDTTTTPRVTETQKEVDTTIPFSSETQFTTEAIVPTTTPKEIVIDEGVKESTTVNTKIQNTQNSENESMRDNQNVNDDQSTSDVIDIENFGQKTSIMDEFNKFFQFSDSVEVENDEESEKINEANSTSVDATINQTAAVEKTEAVTEKVSVEAQTAQEYELENIQTTIIPSVIAETVTSLMDGDKLETTREYGNDLRHVFTSPELLIDNATNPSTTSTSTEVSNKSTVSVEPLENKNNVLNSTMFSTRTSTSTEISHETEICFRGRCVKTSSMDKELNATR